jgi:hypothetical protein
MGPHGAWRMHACSLTPSLHPPGPYKAKQEVQVSSGAVSPVKGELVQPAAWSEESSKLGRNSGSQLVQLIKGAYVCASCACRQAGVHACCLNHVCVHALCPPTCPAHVTTCMHAGGGTLFSWGLNEARLGRKEGPNSDNSVPEAALSDLQV